jgi:hypothetical protein
MTGTDLEVRHEPREMAVLTNEQLQFIAGTEFVPPGLRGNLPAILACVATGRALGIADMSALRSIHIIDGKATFSAELMVQLVRRAGHSITGEVTDGKATVTGTRADNGDSMTSTWTLEMAERAGLLNKQNWKKYPEAMLWARAASQLCRMLFADCFAGATYTPEELDGAESFDHQPAPEPPAGEPPMTAAQKKKANILVSRLREQGRLTTEEVYVMAGIIDPESYRSADGTLHWSPLRDSLTKKQAIALIDLLEKHEASGETAVLDPWHYGDAVESDEETTALESELLTLADRLGKRADVEAALDRKRDEPGFAEWLQAQVVRARGAAASSEEVA